MKHFRPYPVLFGMCVCVCLSYDIFSGSLLFRWARLENHMFSWQLSMFVQIVGPLKALEEEKSLGWNMPRA